ncbi:dual specificity protein phosphatase 19 [Anoplophora glabripennis]|uniref:dual specificity protein phosphatase 19 n=1 Tax=Anoplophora glabripennis TaxID=217634 RepID=UPI0008737E5A|nr:dual specificity protein phosphatase 19 [Anoplophora glabripennis]
MSLLESIRAKKEGLKLTETLITHVDGRRFKETKDSTTEVVKSRYGYVVDTKPDDVPAEVLPFLYLGSQDCCDECVLRKYDLTCVLSVGIEAPVRYSGITYKYITCLDLPETDLESTLKECIPFVQQAKCQNRNVLVHCNAGVSRSASVIIGYLILVEGYSYVEAYDIVKTARNCIKPNTGFEKQLRCLSSSKIFF